MADVPVPPLTPAEPAPPGRLQQAEAWLKTRARFVVGVLLGASILLRFVYWLEVKDTPCPYAHRWTQTDMHFFDEWARAIAAGDWLSNGEYHPVMEWQKTAAAQWFAEHPEERAKYGAAAGDDAALYRALWNRWFGGKQFHQEPMYTYLVAITYRLFGPDPRWVFLWQMLLGVASNLLIWLIARRYFGEVAAAIAGLFALFYAPLLFYEIALVRTTLTAFIGLALALVTDWALRTNTLRAWLAAGLAFGAALLCQTTFAAFVAASLLLMTIAGWADKRALLKRGGLMAAGVLLGMSPLMIRNAAVGAPLLGWASVGPLTFLSDNEASYEVDAGPGGLTPEQVRIMGRTNGKFGAIVVESLKSHPSVLGWPRLLLKKFAKIWHWYEEPDNQNLYYYRLHSSVLRNAPFTFAVIAPLTLVGLAVAAPKWRVCAPLVAMLAAGVAVMLLALPLSRYRVPFVAGMIPFAAYAVVRCFEWAAERRWKPAAGAAVAVLLLAVWTWRPLPAIHPLVRPADHAAPYTYFWGVAAQKAASEGRWSDAAAILGGSLRYEPRELQELQALPAPVTGLQVLYAGFYASVYEAYADTLARSGQPEQARAAAARASMLRAVAAAIPSGTP